MSFTPVPDVGANWGAVLNAMPGLPRAKRSIVLTSLFAIALLLGIVMAVGAIGFFAGLADRQSSPSGMDWALIVIGPALFIVFGIIGLVRWSNTWKDVSGDALVDAYHVSFSRTDPEQVWRALETATSESDPSLQRVLRELEVENGPVFGAYHLWVKHVPRERMMIAIVSRAMPRDERKPEEGLRYQLDRQPVVRRGDTFIDMKAAGKAAKADRMDGLRDWSSVPITDPRLSGPPESTR